MILNTAAKTRLARKVASLNEELAKHDYGPSIQVEINRVGTPVVHVTEAEKPKAQPPAYPGWTTPPFRK